MKKTVWIAVAVAAVFVFGGAVSAHMADGDWGHMGYGYGPGWCLNGTGGTTNVDNLKKFQKETLTLRDELQTKQAELGNEYAKSSPDTARVNALQEEIAGIQSKIQQYADKYGVTAGGGGQCRGFRGPGRMYASGTYGCSRW